MLEKMLERGVHLRILSTILVLILILTVFLAFSEKIYSTNATPTNVYSEWRLVIDGSVETPLTLSLSDLEAMPKNEVNGAIYCGVSMVASGNWGGVKISNLLERAAVDAGATNLEFRADDGYAINVAVEAALQQGFIIAYDLDGQPLVEMLRLALPGYPGNYWISTITKITLTASTDYNIGPNYYAAQLGGGHPESDPTPKPTVSPKSTPFRLPTPPPVLQSTATPQPTQTPVANQSAPPAAFPSSIPTQPETQTTNSPNAPLFKEPKDPRLIVNLSTVSNLMYTVVVAVVVVILAVGLIFLRRKHNLIKRV